MNFQRLNCFNGDRRGVELKRAMLSSSTDEELMAVESSKASLCRQLFSHFDEVDSPNTYSYYQEEPNFYGSPNSINDIKQHPVTTAFSSIFNKSRCVLQVNTSTHTQTDSICGKEFHCKCSKCSKNDCRGRNQTQAGFKSNIKTFCESSTMTPTLIDIKCGCTPACSKSSLGTSQVESETDDRFPTRDYTSRPLSPILKKNAGYDCSPKKISFSTLPDEHHIDIENNYPSRSRSIRSFLRLPKYKCKRHDCQETGQRTKNIYNEGISDVILEQIPDKRIDAKQVPLRCQQRQKPDCSRPSNTSFYSNNYIPYSHKHSRYHFGCTENVSREYVLDDDDGSARQFMVPCSNFSRSSRDRTPLPGYRACPRHPKKVLPSQMNLGKFEDGFRFDSHAKYRNR